MTPPVKIALFTTTTPGADSNDYVLFDSYQSFPGRRYCATLKMQRLVLSILNAAAGTLKGYRSTTERGVSGGAVWTQVYSQSVAAATANQAWVYDLMISEYDDFKLVWTNGGSSQTTWVLDLALEPSQVKVS